MRDIIGEVSPQGEDIPGPFVVARTRCHQSSRGLATKHSEHFPFSAGER